MPTYNDPARRLTMNAQAAVAKMMPTRANEMLGTAYYRTRVAASLRALADAIEAYNPEAAADALRVGGLVNRDGSWIFPSTEENNQAEERSLKASSGLHLVQVMVRGRWNNVGTVDGARPLAAAIEWRDALQRNEPAGVFRVVTQEDAVSRAKGKEG